MMTAAQACDFVDGKIIVSSGLATSASPNEYRILNTNGDLISELILGDLTSVEQEGIFVDRTTYEIYISKLSGNVYKISYN